MKAFAAIVCLMLCSAMLPLSSVAAEQAPPIEKVELAPNRVIHVNGQPFFPIMAWLQDAANFPAVRDCGMNTTAGYWYGSSGTKDVVEYQAMVAQGGAVRRDAVRSAVERPAAIAGVYPRRRA